MQILIDIFKTIYIIIYYSIRNVVFIFVPPSWRYKDVSSDIVLITGAGSGLGRLLSLKFAKAGCKVVLWDINREGNEETARLVRDLGGKAHSYNLDITDKDQVYKTAEKVVQTVGDVTILVNNAGVVSGKALLDTPDYLIERTFNVNVISHFWTIKAFLPAMLKADRGHIVTVASMAGITGSPMLVDYCSSKFAAVGLDESLRLELYTYADKKNLRTTCICPYYINTGMFSGVKSDFLPILKQEDVADKIYDGILTEEEVVIIPAYLKPVLSLKCIMPVAAHVALIKLFGAFEAMNSFTGRGEGTNKKEATASGSSKED